MYPLYDGDYNTEYKEDAINVEINDIKRCINKRPIITDEEKTERNQHGLLIIYNVLQKNNYI